MGTWWLRMKWWLDDVNFFVWQWRARRARRRLLR